MSSKDIKTDSSSTFFNRDISWIDFNERVLGEALRKNLPPLERLRFLSIMAANFDEFFMVRVAAIKRAKVAGGETDPSGLTAAEVLERISRKARSIMRTQFDALLGEIIPDMAAGGLNLIRHWDWSVSQKDYLESLFAREIYPLLTPLRINDEEPLPSIGNYSLYVAFLLEEGGDAHPVNLHAADRQGVDEAGNNSANEFISVIRIPPTTSRVIWLPEGNFSNHLISGQIRRPLPDEGMADVYMQSSFALLEDMIQVWGSNFYPGYKITGSLVFKVNRDADFSVDEKRDEDFIEAMAEVLESRDRSRPVRMVYTPESYKILDYIARRLSLGADDLYEVPGPLNLGDLYDQITGFDHLREKPWKIYPHPAFSEDQPIWERISQGDVFLHLPYQSFDPVVRFFQEAASDPHVLVIKTTLYRTSGDSPIIRALEQASLSGKHVTAVVELKARFDEGRNISWANRLEKAGVIVVYGLARLKIHAKVTLVMRREYDRIKRYVHLSTGNYNDKTAKLYEDLSLFTSREDIAFDVGLLFNMITGYSAVQLMGRLVIAPIALKRRLMDLIEREIKHSSPDAPGRIMAKMNSLADPDIIKALYKASRAGVKISLNVRGICMLVPGVKDLSENIRVVSVIDHYLEHSRIYYFANHGSEELYLASADLMTRNLERRVELMFPVLQEDSRKMIFDILSAYFQDNCQSWFLGAEGVWTKLEPNPGEKAFRVQAHFHSRASKACLREQPGTSRGEFIVRRSPPNKD